MTRFVGTPVSGVEFANAGDEAISARVSGDSNARLRIDAGGRLTWGEGSGAGDTTLYRSAANTLETDDAFTAASLAVTDGSAAAPSLSFSADSDTGIFRDGDNTIGFTAGGVELLSVGSADVDVVTGHLNVFSNTGSDTISLGEYSGGSNLAAIETSSFYALMGTGNGNDAAFIRTKGTGSLILGASHGSDLTIATGGAITLSSDLTVGGDVITSDGSATAPSLTFASDGDTGVFLPAANQLGFAAGGVELLRVGSADVDVMTGHLNLISNTGAQTMSLGEWSAGFDYAAVETPSMVVLMGNASNVNSQGFIRTKGTGSLSLGTNNSNDLTIATGGAITLSSDLTVGGDVIASSLAVTGQLSAANGVITLTTAGAPTVALSDGAIAIDTTNDKLYLRSQGAWVVVGDVSGNASTATALETARTIELTGDVTGSTTFDGSSNVAISASLAVVVNDISDVSASSPSTGDFLIWDGSAWSNGAGDVAFDSITLGTAPTQAGHAVTKSYVDNLASGIDWHEATRLATDVQLPNGPTYSNGTSGDGATFTAGTQARLVVNGSNANTGDRILVKNQTNGFENGVYVVTAQGASGTEYWVLTRANDFDGTQPGGVQPGEAVFVLAGSTNANQGFVVTSTNDPHTIGTDSITFTQFTGTQAFSAGGGLTKTGNTIDVVTADSGRIVVNADSIDLGTVTVGSTSGSATQSFVSSVTTDSYGRAISVETSSLIQGLGTGDSPSFVTVTADLTGSVTGSVTGNVSGDVTGNVTGGVTGNVTGDVTGNVTGGVTGNVTGDLTGDVTGTVSDISNHDLAGLGDTTITSVASGEFLKWNGTAWINETIPEINTLNDIANVTITSASTGDILEWNGSAWVNTTLALNDLSDVDMATLAPSEGDVAYFDGTNWVPYSFTIQNAGGVSTSTETSGDILLYNGTNYVNTAHTLGNITNATLTSEADGDFLKYNGTAWVNASIPEINTLNDVGNVTITSATSGEVPQWNGTAWVNVDILANTDLTGTPTASTAATTTSTTQIATTAFVQQEINALVDAAPGTLDTLNELAAALGDDASFSTTVTNSLALKAPLDSPTFTGAVDLPAGTSLLHDYDAYGASHTLVIGNQGHTLEVSATATITIPTNASVSFPVGTVINVLQTGTGVVTISPAAGVTSNYAVGNKTREQWSMVTLHKRGTDTWLLTGDAKA